MSAGTLTGLAIGSLLGVGSITNFYPFSFGFISGGLITIFAEVVFAFAGMEIQNKIKKRKEKCSGSGIHRQHLQRFL